MRDNRGQSLGIAMFFIALVAGGIIIWINTEIGTPILEHAMSATNNPDANAATAWFQTFMVYLPAVFLLLGFFGLLARAIFQRGIRT